MVESKGTDQIKINVPNKPEYVSVVRLTASSIASRVGFNIDEIDDIKVAIGEACTNAIQHGLSEKGENYEVEFVVYEDKLCINVKDNGTGTCSGEIIEPKEGELKERGLGLFIINTLMDEVECISHEGKGTELRMTKRIGVDNHDYSRGL